MRQSSGKKPQERHGVFDILLSQLAYEELQPRLVWKALCPDSGCRERIDRFNQFYHKLGDREYQQVKPPDKVRLLEAAVNRRRNTAEDEMLYSLEAIEARQNFAGGLILSERKRALFQEALREALGSVSLGGGSSRGMGRVCLDWRELEQVGNGGADLLEYLRTGRGKVFLPRPEEKEPEVPSEEKAQESDSPSAEEDNDKKKEEAFELLARVILGLEKEG